MISDMEKRIALVEKLRAEVLNEEKDLGVNKYNNSTGTLYHDPRIAIKKCPQLIGTKLPDGVEEIPEEEMPASYDDIWSKLEELTKER